jgi:hypothetical protein
MKNYYIEANPSWTIVSADNKREAHKEGKKEYGTGSFLKIREATKKEVEYFINIKGKNALQERQRNIKTCDCDEVDNCNFNCLLV